MRAALAAVGAQLALAACTAAPPAGPSFAFTHDTTGEHWPFGLDDVTTKIVAEPAAPEDSSASYWVVRATENGSAALVGGELLAEFAVRAEFPGTSSEPRDQLDYSIVTGEDRNGAVTTAEPGGRFTVRIPSDSNARQSGFVVRARFPGDRDGPEAPKSLLVELVRVADLSGREFALGRLRVARWLIVDPETAEPVRSR